MGPLYLQTKGELCTVIEKLEGVILELIASINQHEIIVKLMLVLVQNFGRMYTVLENRHDQWKVVRL